MRIKKNHNIWALASTYKRNVKTSVERAGTRFEQSTTGTEMKNATGTSLI